MFVIRNAVGWGGGVGHINVPLEPSSDVRDTLRCGLGVWGGAY